MIEFDNEKLLFKVFDDVFVDRHKSAFAVVKLNGRKFRKRIFLYVTKEIHIVLFLAQILWERAAILIKSVHSLENRLPQGFFGHVK